MENTKIFLENGLETQVNGIFYIYNANYYFIYTLGEKVDSDYVQLYVVQVCKEVKNTENGPVDTGYMLGIETTDESKWASVQQSITKIVESKKSGVSSAEIQILPISMLINLKVVSKNKFKFMKSLLTEIFNLSFDQEEVETPSETVTNDNIDVNEYSSNDVLDSNSTQSDDENVIIDYRAKFFEEQEKNKQLEEQLKGLQEKLESIKSII